MHVKTIKTQSFRRFTDLALSDLPEGARLVMMIGPNGSGKSALFDAFKVWHQFHEGPDSGRDVAYHMKQGTPQLEWNQLVEVEFYEDIPQDQEGRKKMIYTRSPYRNQSDFTASGLRRMPSVYDAPRAAKMIDEEKIVADNYNRLISATIEGVYAGTSDEKTVKALREELIGQVQESMANVFEGLNLRGVGSPLDNGSFFFEKGTSIDFHYKNLSGGEKAAFDLLLDCIVKVRFYNNTVYCIDEPELHMHTKLQARLLGEIMRLLPPNCQLWLASHSIGMMRKAKELHVANPSEVAFLDFSDKDFDQTVTMTPARVDRLFWQKTLEVALDDLAKLVAPAQVVLCEGKPATPAQGAKAEFDAQCYRKIFAQENMDTDFLSVGNESDVRNDRLEIGKAIQTLISGTNIIRLVDRDDRSQQEISELQRVGVRVLGRRSIESYLLDDEIISALCNSVNQAGKLEELIAAKELAIQESGARGNQSDDMKSVASGFYVSTKKILQLTQHGNTADAFLRDTLAPLVNPSMHVFAELKRDIFGEG